MALVLTDAACEALIGSGALARVLSGESDSGLEVERLENRDLLAASGREGSDYHYAVINEAAFDAIPLHGRSDAIARIHRVLRSASRGSVRLPSSWAEFHHGSLITFFAVPEGRNDGGLRWIAELVNANGSVGFHRITDRDNRIALADYESSGVKPFRAALDALIERAKSRKIAVDSAPRGIVEQVDFDAIGASAISQSLSYDDWQSRLSAGQRQVIAIPTRQNVRIIGAAGSGKTVALCLRALKEAGVDENGTLRILFATHSWAMAERIDGALSSMGRGNIPEQIEVLPLLQVLRDVLKGDFVGRVSVLGDDSTEGRAFQLELIEELLADVSEVELSTLTSQGLSRDLASALRNRDVRGVAENLYQEFNGVLMPEGIRPGDSRRIESYLNQERTDEMPPFPSRGDRLLALLIYRGFLAKLREWGVVTNDQLVSDAIRVLETFAWDVRRETAGYDVIFVDELQLFDAQERLALTLLSRSVDAPVFVTAEDPSQGIFSTVSPAWRQGALSGDTPIELATAHRFNKGILAFVKHLYLAFPLNASSISLEPGHDVSDGSPPEFVELSDEADLVSVVAQTASDFHSHGGRVAIVTLGYDARLLAEQLTPRLSNLVLVDSLDDIERLSYQRRSIVVGSWRYLGGTQFDRIVVVGNRFGRTATAFDRMRELISLYVASSRASKELTLVFANGVPDIVRKAVDSSLLKSAKRK